MKKTGFLKLFHSMLQWEWYDDVNVTRLFLHCLLKSNFKNKYWHNVLVVRGSFITSLVHLSEETKLSIQEIRTAINKLKSTQEINIYHTNRYSIIVVNKYNLYQLKYQKSLEK